MGLVSLVSYKLPTRGSKYVNQNGYNDLINPNEVIYSSFNSVKLIKSDKGDDKEIELWSVFLKDGSSFLTSDGEIVGGELSRNLYSIETYYSRTKNNKTLTPSNYSSYINTGLIKYIKFERYMVGEKGDVPMFNLNVYGSSFIISETTKDEFSTDATQAK